MVKTISSTQFKSGIKTGKQIKATLEKSYFEPIEVGADRTATFVFSSNIQDREDDVIDPRGIDVKNYLKNRVILFSHEQKSWPIGETISLAVVGNKLIGTIKFHEADMPISGIQAEEAWRQINKGLMGVSIGFVPKEWEFNESKGLNYNRVELIEASIVSVPANPEALIISSSEDTKSEEPSNDNPEGYVTECVEPTKSVKAVKVYDQALKIYFGHFV